LRARDYQRHQHPPLISNFPHSLLITPIDSSRLLGSFSHLPSLPLQTPDALLVPLGAHPLTGNEGLSKSLKPQNMEMNFKQIETTQL